MKYEQRRASYISIELYNLAQAPGPGFNGMPTERFSGDEFGDMEAALADRSCRGLQPMGRFSGRIAQHGRQNRMVEKKKAPAPKRGRRTPRGDRRQFLTMMSPDVIKAVKQAAIADDRAAWDVMEEAAKQWLDRREGKRGN
jgi:hypothetical protein